MQTKNVKLLFVFLLFFGFYIVVRSYLLGSLSERAIYVSLLGLLIGLNMFYYVVSLRVGKERILVYAILPITILYMLISRANNVILPMVIVLCILVAVNISRSISRKFGNRSLSGPDDN